MFDQNGFDVTVLEPVYAGYGWVPDLSIFQDYPDIRRFNVRGYFSDPKLQAQAIRSNKRNFFCYALMKAAPLCIQANLYDYGTYNQGNFVSDEGYAGQSTDGALTASGISAGFMNSYNVLANLPNITQISKDDTNTYMVLTNDTTHDPVLLQEPEYVPAPEVDNTQYEREHADRFTVNGRTMTVEQRNDYAYYQCNVAALLQLGKWFDYLRENGVYDNTRIIVMSDHGGTMGQFPELLADDGMDAELCLAAHGQGLQQQGLYDVGRVHALRRCPAAGSEGRGRRSRQPVFGAAHRRGLEAEAGAAAALLVRMGRQRQLRHAVHRR